MIQFHRVTMDYPATRTRALDNVDLHIKRGEFVFLIGHSGAGKSTLLNLLVRRITPTSGQIYVAGENLTKYRHGRVAFHRRRIGVVFQDTLLLTGMTALENVAFALRVVGAPPRSIEERATQALRLVGLGHKRRSYPIQLSAGEQQRVAIARALVTNPPVLIADEPTGNLDPQISLEILDLLSEINIKGTTVIVATHSRDLVDRARRRVIMLRQGRIVRDDERGGYSL